MKPPFCAPKRPDLPLLGMLPADPAVQERIGWGWLSMITFRRCASAAEEIARALHRGYPMTTTIALAGKGGVGKTTIAAMVDQISCRKRSPARSWPLMPIPAAI